MKPVRVGVIGAGWGQLQIESFRRVRAMEVVALCDSDKAKLESVAKRYKIATTFSNHRDLLARDDVDLISIATPPGLHYAITRAAIDAGKHVVCEKPLALAENDARDLLAHAEKQNIVHAVDYEMRYLPAIAYAKELIDEEYLGQLLRVDVTMTLPVAWGREHGNWAADDARGDRGTSHEFSDVQNSVRVGQWLYNANDHRRRRVLVRVSIRARRRSRVEFYFGRAL